MDRCSSPLSSALACPKNMGRTKEITKHMRKGKTKEPISIITLLLPKPWRGGGRTGGAPRPQRPASSDSSHLSTRFLRLPELPLRRLWSSSSSGFGTSLPTSVVGGKSKIAWLHLSSAYRPSTFFSV